MSLNRFSMSLLVLDVSIVVVLILVDRFFILFYIYICKSNGHIYILRSPC